MAMTIANNSSAMMVLGELNKNLSSLGKQLKKISSGQRINGAGDEASGFSISEKMRVRIRALDQDERNVQNGAALLRVAEGAIQQQIEIMKTIKQKVIDADNDTNTDADRLIIQKEINQGYQQIEDIAQETNYNTKRLLVGDTVADVVRSWIVTDTPVFMPDSDDLNLIPDNLSNDPYVSSDGTLYDNFNEWTNTASPISSIHLEASNTLSGGAVVASSRIMSFDLASCNLSDLNNNSKGIGFYIDQAGASSTTTTRKYFVLSTDPSATYKVYSETSTKGTSVDAVTIAVNSSMSKTDIANAMANAINSNTTSTLLHASVDGTKVKVETQSGYTGVSYANACKMGGWRCDENPAAEIYTTTYTTTGSAGISDGYLYGGAYAVTPTPSNPDVIPSPAVPDTYNCNISGASAGSSIRVDGPSGYEVVLNFSDTADGLSGSTIGKNYAGTFTYAGLTVTMDGAGNMHFSTPHSDHTYYISDGAADVPHKNVSGTIAVKEVKSLTSDIHSTYKIDQTATESDKKRAYCTFDLSDYTSKYSMDDLNAFISDMQGKVMTWRYRTNETYSYSAYWETTRFGFIDRSGDNVSDTVSGQYHSRDIEAQLCAENVSQVFDLNELRSRLTDGKSVADVIGAWLKEKFGAKVSTHDEDPSVAEGTVHFLANLNGPAGNTDTIKISKGEWRQYPALDFETLLDGKSIPDDLDGRGFRFYCATHHGQWFNFEFLNGNLDDKPLSGTDTSDIKTLLIDVSEVHDAKDLANAIYDQAMTKLASGNPYWDHYIRLATDDGKLIIYDNRARNVNTSEYEYQIDGAKLADGIIDNVIRGKRNIYVKDLVIHHTDHASQNIYVRIPQTTMDHLFGYVAGEKEFSEFNVLTSESREKLLGNKAGTARRGELLLEDEEGLLDKALNYLTSANTLVGAQIMRLGMTENNIVTSRESTISSESTLRDADMAAEMAGFTKTNILAQAAQSMLAQANQSASNVLSLLQ